MRNITYENEIYVKKVITIRQALPLPDMSYDRVATELIHTWVIARFHDFYTRFKPCIQSANANIYEVNDLYLYWIRVHVSIPSSKLDAVQAWIKLYEAY